MKLYDQVCSFKFAEKLKKLGVKQHSVWYWTDGKIMGNELSEKWSGLHLATFGGVEDKEACISAFTVAELGMMLPDKFHCSRVDGLWIGGCFDGTVSDANTEADARAKMLIHLIEVR